MRTEQYISCAPHVLDVIQTAQGQPGTIHSAISRVDSFFFLHIAEDSTNLAQNPNLQTEQNNIYIYKFFTKYMSVFYILSIYIYRHMLRAGIHLYLIHLLRAILCGFDTVVLRRSSIPYLVDGSVIACCMQVGHIQEATGECVPATTVRVRHGEAIYFRVHHFGRKRINVRETELP